MASQDAIQDIESLIREGRLEAAEALCQQILARSAADAQAWARLGAIALMSNRPQQAESALRSAVRLNPDDAISWHHLSVVLAELSQVGQAEHSSRHAVELNSSEPRFWLQLGNVLFAQERFDEASPAFRQSVAFDPFNPIAWNSLGSSEHVQNRLQDAQSAYESSLALDPAQTETLLKLAHVFEKQWSLCEALALVRQVLALEPQRGDAWLLLGRLYLSLGQQQPAAAALQHCVWQTPTPAAHSRLLQSLQYADDITPAALLTAHCAWEHAHAQQPPSAASPIHPVRERDRPLRIGFVAADFGINPIGFLTLPLLEHFDKAMCSIVCYFDGRGEDTLTVRFKTAADQWRVTHGLSTAKLAEQVMSDEIDILVDLMGHVGNRLPLFTSRPAPMQVTWLGYVGTTGLNAIDYLLADRFHVRPGEESDYAESVLRLPHGYACYGPPVDAPDVGPLPALSERRITFGSFNNPAKFSASTFDAWCQVLRRVPEAQLFLKYGGLHQPETQARIRSEFSKRDIQPQRVLLEGWSPHRELLESYNRVDMGLDTQPYSGGLTTCEALWMGVPTITYPGKTFAGRHSTSHMTNAGYPQFVADDLPGYVELAVEWANRLAELAAIRAQIREQVRRTPLCDAPRFAGDFLSVLRQGWESCCRRQSALP